MRTCTEPCSRGFNRCCKDCQIEEFCTVKCSYQVCDHEEKNPRARKDRIAKKFRKTNILILIAIALVIFFGLIIIEQLNEIAVLSVDILNTEQLANQEQKNGVSEDLAAYGYTLTAEERELVERVVMSESGDQIIEAQMAVSQTIYDRMNNFGDPLETALVTYSTHDNGTPTESVKKAVSNVFDNGERIFVGGTYQFHDKTVYPYWVKDKYVRGTIGELTFYGGYKE